ncbi:hypothetical protein LC612_30625 [Nostoc sp. CHAB 5834]|nr:hypothetical protein [Nostoc sp. CHAB 5834]
MSKIKTLQAQLVRERDSFIKEVDQKISFLNQLPKTPVEPTAFSLKGYEADYSLVFNCKNAQLPELWQAYPPVDLVEVWSSSWTIKPKCRLTEHESKYSDVTNAFNRYLRKGEHLHGIYWWTRINDSLVNIRVVTSKDEQPALLPDPEVWEPKEMPGGTAGYLYFIRKLAEVKGLPAVDSKSPDLIAIRSKIKMVAEKTLSSFLSDYSSFKDESYPRKCFENMLRNATGYAVDLVYARCRQSTAVFCIHLNKDIETLDIQVKLNPEKPTLHKQNFPVEMTNH